MKITNGPVKKRQEELRAEANKGCDVCPCCGEDKPRYEYALTDDTDRGIVTTIPRHKRVGIIRKRWIITDMYICKTCGARWESEPYEEVVDRDAKY